MDAAVQEYINEYIVEAREHLNSLNNLLVELEKNPQSKDIINGIFRSFHTLKGNSAAMGFSNLAELAHQLENVLGKIRDGLLGATADITSILLEGLDNIEKCIAKIESESNDSMDFSQILQKVSMINPAQQIVKKASILELTPIEKQDIEESIKAGKKIFKVKLIFRKEQQLKDAKAMVVLRNISSCSKLIATNPKKDQLASIDDIFEMIVATDDEELLKKSSSISGLEKIDIDPFLVIAQSEKKEQAAVDTSKVVADLSKDTQSVRVSMERLDKFMEMIGELAINRMRLFSVLEKYESQELNELSANFDRLILAIQEEVIEERMVPIGQIYNKFPRMIRDLSIKLNRKINFITEGNDIKFDRTVLDEIGDPLVHILRNSVDHGVETPEARKAAKKPEEGIIKISARREKGFAVIDILDDGAGIDPEEVKNVAIKKGVINQEQAKTMSAEDAQMLIFNPGMSTAKEVTEISGRGVGMNVVKSKVAQLGGKLKLTSQKGSGTKISMYLPLTVAIIQSLLVKVKDELYAVPLSSVEIVEDIPKSKIKTIQGYEVFTLFNEEIPLLRMHDLFKKQRVDRENYAVIVVEQAGKKVGLLVDEILRKQQILIKTLGSSVKNTKGISGATIMEDGSVCLILDLSSLVS